LNYIPTKDCTLTLIVVINLSQSTCSLHFLNEFVLHTSVLIG